jgi:hypothetical protein
MDLIVLLACLYAVEASKEAYSDSRGMKFFRLVSYFCAVLFWVIYSLSRLGGNL